MPKQKSWQNLPGNFDTVHGGKVFPSNNAFGLPDLQPTFLKTVPSWLVPYGTRIRSHQDLRDGAVHFFLDDYRFEAVWSKPNAGLDYLRQFEMLLGSDFSLYVHYPLAVQLYNVYRNRWLAAQWQQQGFTVIPTVSWSTPESYSFCFAGIPRHQPVALSTVGIHTPQSQWLFEIGYRRMLEVLKPSIILCYGSIPVELKSFPPQIHEYPTRWSSIARARKLSQKQITL